MSRRPSPDPDRPGDGGAPAARRRPDPARRNARSRAAILGASLQLVGEVGYARLTIEAIAARAGVGKQTIYRWWPSKAAVLLDAFTESGGGEGAEDAAVPDTGDLGADLRAVLRATADEFSDPEFEAPYRALAVAGAQDAELSREFDARLADIGTELYVARLRSAREAGQIRDDVDLRLAAEMLTGPFFQRWLARRGPLDHAFTDALVDAVLAGLRPRG
ncbi:TetR/AcrR family transcriptional regulator [Streptomyces spiramenti]|uniref:TetR/AcrR family transcriptional regulator n=1 Tax=Streptomyces spiramenti TaxID=2720606 RepID=A0ABX1AL06_9ACTN|nr:TetR/AcrR family transcriptional regulator [Streptomyces spiramenti]NJP66073.1 TetR/AcrR family transcriptional regulator [Streptomyces spiramenti]